MQNRSPRTILAVSAVLALTVSAFGSTAVLAKGPGPGAGECDGDCVNEQSQAQPVRARDGSGQQSETQANAGGGQNVQARNGGGNGRNVSEVNGRDGDTADRGGNRANQAGRNANAGGKNTNQNQNQGAGRGKNDDTARGPGTCEDCDAEMGELTVAQQEGLVFMANEEKLAAEVYAKFAVMYGLPVFENIAKSEVRHLVAVDTMLDRYGLENPAIDLPEGEFSDDRFTVLYAQLVEQGSASLEEALAVGVLIEGTDIADLEERMVGLEDAAPDVHNMYSHLLTGSGYHLAAFGGGQ